MRSLLLTLSALTMLALSGCGSPAPLVADPQYDPKFGPSVQLDASRNGQNLVVNGVAQGVTQLQAQLIHGGRVVKTQPITINQLHFTLTIGPVQNGDEVELIGDNGYREGLSMTFPAGVVEIPDSAPEPQPQSQALRVTRNVRR